MDKKISVIFSSHLSEQENQEFKDHVKSTIGFDDVYVHCIENKKQYSLTEAYNIGWKAIDDMGRGNGVIIFCHNDILFRTKGWGMIIYRMLLSTKFDILGVAGTTELNSHGCWWLQAEGKEMNLRKMFGRVWHPKGLREEESVYSKKISGVQEVVIVDGLFFAINGESELKRFDESFKGFHMYDISFSFENYLEGFNVGVIDRVSIFHKSVGQTNQEWELNRIQFAEKYKDELPAKIV